MLSPGYDVLPNAPEALDEPKRYGFGGYFNRKSGATEEYQEKLPENRRQQAAFERYQKIEGQIEKAHVGRGLGDDWASMDKDRKLGLVRATSAISAISEEADKQKKEIADLQKKIFADIDKKFDDLDTKIEPLFYTSGQVRIMKLSPIPNFA